MKILGVIPARYASTRFPGKPLIEIGGKSMIRRVYEQANLAKSLTHVIVATDDQRIADEVESFGGEYVMTNSAHESGTDRCAEVAKIVEGYDVIINIQGDEPFINPLQIDLLANLFKEDTEIATLIKPIQEQDELVNPNLPKVVISKQGKALYFSRTPIPYLRGVDIHNWNAKHQYFRHIGIYGYRKNILLQLTNLPISLLEKSEQLEQLRWLENGFNIQTAITEFETIAVDVPEDLDKIKAWYL
ncbi:3-deoxy-manno-octulosonate cytidylyltransferase [Pedobacter flavus]|uniref:3-deoxy-manno-octulosonate cytidylyltransferase n=1 Tax=Pedobacter flavus TaxID=3113906 RepID=A0ABU7H3I7_9SPHI|nr:3-deoxy-manno-octulosonate cytidylyltransferase [Pedobacter sp. VNH31]MEE1885866.1 3-deoxy-manno-octulosonate cytidylyltransferase [Pedobacter sp. VNH31]